MNQLIIDAFRNGLMWICLSALAALVVCALLSFVVRRKQVRPVFARIPPVQCMVLLVVMAVCTLFSGKNTNSPPAGIMSPLLPRSTGGTPVAPVVVTPEEIAQGWRVVAETNCDANVYVMPDGVSPSFNWHRRGTFGEWSRLDLGGFAFPLGTNDETFSSLSVFSDGRIRPTPRDAAREICAVGVPMLAMQGASRFWWADSATAVAGRPPYQSKLLTWENFFLHADTNAPVNAQIELFTNGDFITRSNALERIHRRVASFDWDGDGLENSVDPEPLVAGTDAHGTNAEWYNVVCSNVLEAVAATSAALPPELTWLEGVNSNAYYFVDVVTECGPTPIYFTGDHDTRLGNPVVVALAGATNRVPLLIGVNYAVTSDTPFAVSFPVDYVHPTVTTNGVSDYNVRWPLNFAFTECIGESNRVYTVTVEPYDPGGVFEWEDFGGGVPMRGGPSGGGCDCMTCDTNSVCFSCSSSKTCETGSAAHGSYILDTTSFSVEGGECRCGFDDPPPGSPPGSHEPNDPPSLTITFSKQAVIFEEAYEERPGEMAPRRSTRVRLTVDAYGGAQGGALWLTEMNMGKLTPIGEGVSLPYNKTLGVGESYHDTGVYEGMIESGSEEDVRVTGSFMLANGTPLSADARLTVVRIRLKPDVDPPQEGTIGRHEYGVCELVEHHQYPSAPAVTWNPVGGGSNTVSRSGQPCFQFPLYGCVNPLRVELNNVSYVPRLTCMEPDGIKAGKVDLCTYGLPPGKAGGIGLLQHYYVTPMTVSFSRIAVEEVPCDQGMIEGYFRYTVVTSRWTHTRSAGAGKWYDVDVHNRVGGEDDVRDEAAIGEEAPPITPDGTVTNDYSYGWMDGSLVWQVPFGWNVRGTKGEAEPFGTFVTLTQEFHIDQSGLTGVRKFGNMAVRLPDDRRFLNFREVFNNIVSTNNVGGI